MVVDGITDSVAVIVGALSVDKEMLLFITDAVS
jgi:hypothetical protein